MTATVDEIELVEGRLRLVRDGAGQADLAAATAAAESFLRALGLDPHRPGLADTAGRMARAYAELFTPEPFTLTTFPNDEVYDELVLARGIPFRSVCEHHLLPFVGVAHVGYLPGERIVGLSKLARVVRACAAAPQVQERLTCQVADLLDERLAPRGVGVVLDAEHLCMSVRGVQAAGTRTRTSVLRGALRDDARTRAEFLTLTAAPTP
jgi:GTP cyclohydrolase I